MLRPLKRHLLCCFCSEMLPFPLQPAQRHVQCILSFTELSFGMEDPCGCDGDGDGDGEGTARLFELT
jgi:hypothetical protein